MQEFRSISPRSLWCSFVCFHRILHRKLIKSNSQSPNDRKGQFWMNTSFFGGSSQSPARMPEGKSRAGTVNQTPWCSWAQICIRDLLHRHQLVPSVANLHITISVVQHCRAQMWGRVEGARPCQCNMPCRLACPGDPCKWDLVVEPYRTDNMSVGHASQQDCYTSHCHPQCESSEHPPWIHHTGHGRSVLMGDGHTHLASPPPPLQKKKFWTMSWAALLVCDGKPCGLVCYSTDETKPYQIWKAPHFRKILNCVLCSAHQLFCAV